MINFFDLLFFHIYKSQSRTGEKETPIASSILGLSFLVFMNVMSLLLVLDIFGLDILSDILDSENRIIITLAIAGGILVMGMIWFYHRKRYEMIITQFSKRSTVQRKSGAKITLIYALVSIIIVFVLAPLRVM